MSNIPKYIAAAMPPIPLTVKNILNINVPSSGGTGMLELNFPDHTQQLSTIGLALARIAAYSISIAEVVTLIVDPKGGVRVKDALDPYQYEIVTKALEANEIPAPAAPPEADTTVNTLGGTIAQTADLLGAAALAGGAINTASQFLVGEDFDLSLLRTFTPGVVSGIVTGAQTIVPDMTPGLQTIKSSLDVIAISMSIIADSLNRSADIPSQALLIKSILSAFTIKLNEQSIKTANREPPTPPQI